MKILQFIQGTSSGPVCEGCKWFQNDPLLIEAIYPGLTSMSSGFASVRDRDGICQHHQRYLSARDSCEQFSPREPGINNFFSNNGKT
jgi:hypothetical protein